MSLNKIEYSPGDVLTSAQMNDIQDAILNNTQNIETHLERENPHGITPEMIGASSGNHTHSAKDIGAADKNHTHSPESIGALATDGSNHMTDALKSKCDATNGEGQFYGNQWGTYIDSNYGDTKNRRGIFIANPHAMPDLSGSMVAYDRVNDSEVAYPLLHTGNFGTWASTLGATRIFTSSYRGNGNYTAANKNSITFPFVPKFVYIQDKTDNNYFALWASGCDMMFVFGGSFSNLPQIPCELNGTTLSWYNDSNAEYQMNMVRDYNFVGIG